MGLFVEIEIDQSKFATREERERLAAVCPVDAFVVEESGLVPHPENEDECTFCDLCVQKAPAGAIKVVKTYQEWITKG